MLSGSLTLGPNAAPRSVETVLEAIREVADPDVAGPPSGKLTQVLDDGCGVVDGAQAKVGSYL
jgi:hypothetical protein